MKKFVAIAAVSALALVSGAYAQDGAQNKANAMPCPMMSGAGHADMNHHCMMHTAGATPAPTTTSKSSASLGFGGEDAAVRAQFGYPGGDSGPYGAAAGNQYLRSGK